MKKILIFAIGAAVGSAVSWQYFKTKYEQLAQEEIDSVREYYSKKYKEKKEEPDDKPQVTKESKSSLKDYASMIKNVGYSKYEKKSDDTIETEQSDAPYVIPPEEFGEKDGYSKLSLTYYADQIVADDSDFIVEDIKNTIGFDSLNHFGEYEDDSVFVRNDRRKCDYEILLSQRRYSDVCKDKPYLNHI